MEATIYHNPNCSTSRKALAMLEEAGIIPKIVQYLKTPPSRDELLGLIAGIGGGPRAILRKKAAPYEALNLADPAVSDEAIIDAIMVHPVLIERPIVVTAKGVRLGRPVETIKEIL